MIAGDDHPFHDPASTELTERMQLAQKEREITALRRERDEWRGKAVQMEEENRVMAGQIDGLQEELGQRDRVIGELGGIRDGLEGQLQALQVEYQQAVAPLRGSNAAREAEEEERRVDRIVLSRALGTRGLLPDISTTAGSVRQFFSVYSWYEMRKPNDFRVARRLHPQRHTLWTTPLLRGHRPWRPQTSPRNRHCQSL